MNCVQSKYGWYDKVVLFSGTVMITGFVLYSKWKKGEFWHNVANYGWARENEILCKMKEA